MFSDLSIRAFFKLFIKHCAPIPSAKLLIHVSLVSLVIISNVPQGCGERNQHRAVGKIFARGDAKFVLHHIDGLVQVAGSGAPIVLE